MTGGDSGIGKAISLHFAREGANVAIAYLDEHQDAEETKKVLEEAGVKVLLLPGDLRSEDQCKYGPTSGTEIQNTDCNACQKSCCKAPMPRSNTKSSVSCASSKA